MITRNIRQICHFSYLFRITHFLSHKSAQLTSTQILHWTKFPLKTLNLNTSICFFHFARQAHELWERVTSVIVPIPWNPETSRNNMNRDMIGRTIITSLLFLFFYHRNSWPILRVQVYAGRKSVSIWKKELCWFTEFAKEKWLHSEPKMTGIPN